ncbi:unnamed protein product [Adineta ricciae]|uniref:Uncharacterized protein n=2 Tax=Adineta ricciae TaxID=249248 RepID=A0A815CFC8_ADIRI|nr:unnamed protein product [Adineta ricciae]
MLNPKQTESYFTPFFHIYFRFLWVFFSLLTRTIDVTEKFLAGPIKCRQHIHSSPQSKNTEIRLLANMKIITILLLIATIAFTFSFAAEEDKKDVGTVIGIDLGTTYSCVGIFKNGRVEIIANDQGNRITPSYVAFTPEGERLIGDAAKNQLTSNPENTVFDAKRLIGRDFNEPSVQQDIKHFPFKVIEKNSKPIIQISTGKEQKLFTPEEISAMVLGKMREIAVSHFASLLLMHHSFVRSFIRSLQAKVRDLCCYAFEILSHPEHLGKKDILLNVVHSKDNVNNYFQQRFELLLPLKDNNIVKYEYVEQHLLSTLKSIMNKDISRITFARYVPERGQWIVIDPLATPKKTKTPNVNLRLEPYKLADMTVIGVLEGDRSTSEDFDTAYDKMKRQDVEQDKEQKRMNRERNRADNDRNQQSGSSGRRRSPQNTMRINVDDFDN